MKKFLVLAITVACLASGCTKKYDSVEEYAKDMKVVQQAQKSYTLEFENLSWMADGYFRAYKKNNLWKYDQSANNGRTYIRTVLYDGNDIIGYNENSKWATIIASPKTEEEKELLLRMHDITSQLFNWDKPGCLFCATGVKPEFVNNKAKMNGFDCRLIKYSDSYEACINDKLGIAVYLKTRMGGDTSKETIVNLKKVDTAELPNSDFVMPSSKQKVSLQQMLKEMSKGNF